MDRLVLMYTNARKPFLSRFYRNHRTQAGRLGARFRCIATSAWDDSIADFEQQREVRCQARFAGILEAILQGLEGEADDTIVYLAEDDCLYQDFRFSSDFVARALLEPDRMLYQLQVSFVCKHGFFRPEPEGLCLHCAYGTVASVRYNIELKWREFNEERDFPASSVEPCSYPTPENPDEANRAYLTRCVSHTDSLSLDFRVLDEQSWTPSGNELFWQYDRVWGHAGDLWSRYIELA